MTIKSLDSWILLIGQIVAHSAMIFGLYYYGFQGLLISIVVYFITGCLGMTVTYHRLLSHRSFKTNKFFEYLGTIFGTYGLVGSSIAWVATHRKHHRYTDTELDPHSPGHVGIFRVQFLSMFEPVELKYAPDLIRNRFHIFVHKRYFHIHLAIIVLLSIVSPYFLIFGYFIPAVILWHAGSAINTVNHLWGYRNYSRTNNSTNNIITGYLMWGEGWHNNHHADPNNWNFKKKWWEFDIGSGIIKTIMK